ncbi:MAG: glycosyltransferase, partial [Ilumatobacteraceae bacterium]
TTFAEAATELGRDATVVSDRLPIVDGSINLVIAPHEFFVLSEEPVAALKQAAAASVSICTEQPNTPWFHLSLDASQRGLIAFDINDHGTAALRQFGVDAYRLPFGAVPSMVTGICHDRRAADRDVDMLFMGSLDPRRGAALAGLASTMWNRRSDLRLFPFDKPVSADSPGVVFGQEKFELLRTAKVLINIHRDRSTHLPPGAAAPAYFEWVRMVETMANGCVVITEPSEGFEPLVEGVHFVSVDIDEMADALDALLRDPDRLQAMADAARRAVTVELPLAASLAPALAMIEAEVLPRLEQHVASGAHARGTWRLREGGAEGPKRLGAFRPYAEVLSRAKQVVLGESETLRRLEAVRALLHHSTEQHIHRTETPAYVASTIPGTRLPDVSVMVTLYDYEHLVAETLDSILASNDVSVEVIIVEDHATDNSRAVAMDYLAAHPDAAMVLLAKDANEGLAAARNTGVAACRADLVMVMDADNLVYPTCLSRLADALHDDPGASFAYAALEQFGAKAGLLSAYAWSPAWLCAANYIDAQTMIRRSVLESLGGYRLGDPLVFGWEDWEMWLRLASRGERGVLVAEMLGRYRVQAGSMIGLTNLSVDESLTHLRDLHPTLPWPSLAE